MAYPNGTGINHIPAKAKALPHEGASALVTGLGSIYCVDKTSSNSICMIL